MLFTVLQASSNAGFLLDSMFDFAERINAMNLNDEELALFSASVIVASGSVTSRLTLRHRRLR